MNSIDSSVSVVSLYVFTIIFSFSQDFVDNFHFGWEMYVLLDENSK